MRAEYLTIDIRMDNCEIVANKGVVEQCQKCKSYCQPVYAITLYGEIAHKASRLAVFRGCAICCREVEARIQIEWPGLPVHTLSLYRQPDGSMGPAFAPFDEFTSVD